MTEVFGVNFVAKLVVVCIWRWCQKNFVCHILKNQLTNTTKPLGDWRKGGQLIHLQLKEW